MTPKPAQTLKKDILHLPSFKPLRPMKIFAATVILIFSFSAATGQKLKDAPGPVKKGFAEKYKGATPGKWQKEGEEYLTTTKVDGVSWEVSFDGNGKWLESEKKVSASEVPEPVKTALKEMLKDGWKLSGWNEEQTPEYTLAYEAMMHKGKESKEVVFAPTGKFLKEEK